MSKTAIVLEGGGMRGAYTAGALTWLIDNNIEFDAGYGISTGAVHLCNFLTKNKENLHIVPIKMFLLKKSQEKRSHVHYISMQPQFTQELRLLKDLLCMNRVT